MKPRAAEGSITASPKRGSRFILKTKIIGNTQSVFSTSYCKRKVNRTMNEKLNKYVDGVFSQYEDGTAIKELKEELKINLQERWNDLKQQGIDDETAYKMTVDSIGDISEAIQSVAGKTKELKQMTNNDLSLMQLEGSDLQGVRIHKGKFNYSALQGTDFSGSDLTDSSFLCSDLANVKFDRANLTGAKFTLSALNGATIDKVTYAVLKGYGANLTNVTVF